MQYLYHRVPNNLRDKTLFPLNQLKQKFPDIYNDEARKYQGREHITQQTIPVLNNCLWNDVIFLTAINPTELFETRRTSGWPEIPAQHFFKIDTRQLDQSKLGVFLFKPNRQSSILTPSDFERYDYNSLKSYTKIPPETRSYYRREFEDNQPRIRLFFNYIPHILYHGSIDITDTEIIQVS